MAFPRARGPLIAEYLDRHYAPAGRSDRGRSRGAARRLEALGDRLRLSSPRMHETRWNDGAFTTQLESLVWTASPIVRRYLHWVATGNPACDWLTGVRFRYLPVVVRRALVLGCGSGWLERALASREAGSGASWPATSPRRPWNAPARRPRARERARSTIASSISSTIRCRRGPSTSSSPTTCCTTSPGSSVSTRSSTTRSSRDGRFVFNEYVGPNRFQYDDERIELVNRYFRLFPDNLRWDPVSNTCLWKRTRIDARKLIEEDPTEAVRSEDVLPLARRAFSPVAEIPYGGGLLNPLLFGVIAGFEPGHPEHDRVLEILCAAEDRLTDAGLLEPDFHIFVGRRGTTATLPCRRRWARATRRTLTGAPPRPSRGRTAPPAPPRE